MIDPWLWFWFLLKSSLFSTSGTGNLPILHDDLISLGWATERHFAEALAIGQITPGPTGLWVISFAYLIDGLRGSLLSFVAILLPPFTVITILRIYQRHGDHPGIQGFVRGLTLAVASIFVVILARIMQQNGIDVRSIAITLGALGLAYTRKVPIPVILLLAGIIGVIVYSA